jgi:glycosyltransferase involved in cell wall biosynthesis
MKPDILIPTCKDDYELAGQIGEIIMAEPEIDGDRIIYSCYDKSAAFNRNYCLNLARSGIVVMIDDDISGFLPGWSEKLIEPLLKCRDIIYVSARLMNNEGLAQHLVGYFGTPQRVMGFSDNLISPIVPVNTAPSAAVAFRNDGTRFDEAYVGSGWEDTDFVRQLKVKYPGGKVVINNEVKLIHANEMKNQLGENYKINKEYFIKKWGAEF